MMSRQTEDMLKRIGAKSWVDAVEVCPRTFAETGAVVLHLHVAVTRTPAFHHSVDYVRIPGLKVPACGKTVPAERE
eukprot:6320225-Alexandrium_andersonii.AAC.1